MMCQLICSACAWRGGRPAPQKSPWKPSPRILPPPGWGWGWGWGCASPRHLAAPSTRPPSIPKWDSAARHGAAPPSPQKLLSRRPIRARPGGAGGRRGSAPAQPSPRCRCQARPQPQDRPGSGGRRRRRRRRPPGTRVCAELPAPLQPGGGWRQGAAGGTVPCRAAPRRGQGARRPQRSRAACIEAVAKPKRGGWGALKQQQQKVSLKHLQANFPAGPPAPGAPHVRAPAVPGRGRAGHLPPPLGPGCGGGRAPGCARRGLCEGDSPLLHLLGYFFLSPQMTMAIRAREIQGD